MQILYTCAWWNGGGETMKNYFFFLSNKSDIRSEKYSTKTIVNQKLIKHTFDQYKFILSIKMYHNNSRYFIVSYN